MADGFVVGAVLSAISYSGDKPQRIIWQQIGEKKALAHFSDATPKRRALNDGCRLWGLWETEWKAFRHTTFCISRIVLVRRERYRELSADGQSPQEYVGKGRQMETICPSLPAYIWFMGLLSLLFWCPSVELFPSWCCFLWCGFQWRNHIRRAISFFFYPFSYSQVPFSSSYFLFHSCLPSSSNPSWLTASSLVLSFSAVSYSVDEPQRMKRQRIGKKKAKRIPAWKPSGRLFRLAHFSVCHS